MKKDNQQELLLEKVMTLYDGIDLYKVNIERCREQDKNARVMSADTFNQLTTNIADDKRLESMPLGYIEKNGAGNEEFKIISGHHRIRAARSANVTEIFTMVIDEELSDAQIKSKQLAHNALSGFDDKQLLKELFDEIDDIDQKIKTGLQTGELIEKFSKVGLEDVSFDFEFKTIRVLFLESQFDKFEKICDLIDEKEKVMVADYESFNSIATAIRRASKHEDVRNVAAIFMKMGEIVNVYYRQLEKKLKEEAKQAKQNGKAKETQK